VAPNFPPTLLTGSKTVVELEYLTDCYKMGWIYPSMTTDSKEIFFSSTPLHRWSAGFTIWQSEPTEPPEDNLIEFVLRVIKSFSPSRLFPVHRVHSSYVQQVPGPQYSQEFYRCSGLSNTQVFPEFGSRPGHVDFYIPSKQWAIELLCDGEDTQEKCMRFSAGDEHTCTSISDHIILDCRQNKPTKGHAGT
jgi:hypothetical protein